MTCGADGKAAWTSGRAPSTSAALPINTRDPAGSPETASRQIRTRLTFTSSSAQPVTATDPLRPVALSDGVSKNPDGAADDLAERR